MVFLRGSAYWRAHSSRPRAHELPRCLGGTALARVRKGTPPTPPPAPRAHARARTAQNPATAPPHGPLNVQHSQRKQMAARQPTTYLPTMLLTMVRRVSAQLPYNQFLFRVAPKHTKAELREYLEKVYNVKVARITTSISLGASGWQRVRAQRRTMLEAPCASTCWLTLFFLHTSTFSQARRGAQWASAPFSTSSRTTSVPLCSCRMTRPSSRPPVPLPPSKSCDKNAHV